MIAPAWLLLAAALAAPPTPPDPSPGVAPVLGPGTLAVARVDLDQLDAAALIRRLAPEVDPAALAAPLAARVDGLRKAGAHEVYFLVDVPNLGGMPAAAVPVAAGVDAAAVGRALTEGGPDDPARWPASATIRGVVVAGSQETLDRIGKAEPAPCPDLLAALEAAAPAPVRAAVSPGAGLRRSLEETFVNLPGPLGGRPIETVTRGLSWASVAIATAPEVAVRVEMQAADEPAARALAEVAGRAVAAVAALAQADPAAAPGLAALVGRVRPEVAGTRVRADLAPDVAVPLAALPLRRAMQSAYRARSFTNLKSLGLAMHNYLSVHGTFPPAYRAGADGRPLLSWRVLILPFLEEQKLYDQFHLDEPWDSPHNLPLAAKMPRVFAAPAAGRGPAGEGKTTYLTLRGPDTLFPGAAGVKIEEVRDGTSNTIAVVEVAPPGAVAWTRPVDWEVTADGPRRDGLFNPLAAGFNLLISDGAALFLPQSTSPITLRALSTRAGGEVVDWGRH